MFSNYFSSQETEAYKAKTAELKKLNEIANKIDAGALATQKLITESRDNILMASDENANVIMKELKLQHGNANALTEAKDTSRKAAKLAAANATEAALRFNTLQAKNKRLEEALAQSSSTVVQLTGVIVSMTPGKSAKAETGRREYTPSRNMNACDGFPVFISPPNAISNEAISGDEAVVANSPAVVVKAKAGPKDAKDAAEAIPEHLSSYSNKLKRGVVVGVVRQLMTLANCSPEDIVVVCGIEVIEPEDKKEAVPAKTTRTPLSKKAAGKQRLFLEKMSKSAQKSARVSRGGGVSMMASLQLGVNLRKSPGPQKIDKKRTLTPFEKRLNSIKLANKAQDSTDDEYDDVEWDGDKENC